MDKEAITEETSEGRESAAALLERLVAVHRELKMGTASSCQLNPLLAARVKRIDDELVSTIDALRLWIGDS